MVHSLGSFDKWLEDNKLLPQLQRPQMDAAMAGADGQMSEECKAVSRASVGFRLGRCWSAVAPDGCSHGWGGWADVGGVQGGELAGALVGPVLFGGGHGAEAVGVPGVPTSLCTLLKGFSNFLLSAVECHVH